MGLYHKIKKDKLMRKYVAKNELNSILLRYNFKSEFITLKKKAIIFYWFLRKFHLTSSISRIVNFCIVTGKARWTFQRFCLSRMTFKTYANKGYLNGIRKSSW